MESKPQKRNWKSCCVLSQIRGNDLKITLQDVTPFNPIKSETRVNGFCPLWLGILINSLRCFEFLSTWICYLIHEIEFNCMTQPPRKCLRSLRCNNPLYIWTGWLRNLWTELKQEVILLWNKRYRFSYMILLLDHVLFSIITVSS